MFTEETLALAIIGTAFVALLLGFFLGMFVTRTCSPKSAHQQETKSPKSSSASSLNSDDLHKYSVTTISSHCDNNQKEVQQQSNRNDFDQASKISVENENSQFKSLPPQFTIGQNQQPMSLNPNNLDRQRWVNLTFSNSKKLYYYVLQVLYGVLQKSTKIWSSLLSTSQPPCNVRTSSRKFKFWTNAFIIKMFLTSTESQTNLSLVLFSIIIMISELCCIFYLFSNFGCESLLCWNTLKVDITFLIVIAIQNNTNLDFWLSKNPKVILGTIGRARKIWNLFRICKKAWE